MISARDRYRTDVDFAALVNVMRSLLDRSRFTPSELREAAILAAVMYEMERPTPTRIVLAEAAMQELEHERDGAPGKRGSP